MTNYKLEIKVEVCFWKEISLEVFNGNESFQKCKYECAGSDKECPAYSELNGMYLTEKANLGGKK